MSIGGVGCPGRRGRLASVAGEAGFDSLLWPLGENPMRGRKPAEDEYSEGPVRGKCKRCGTYWTISHNANDEWRNQCPRARLGQCEAEEGEYILDPADDPRNSRW
jgi:hypothetical protein